MRAVTVNDTESQHTRADLFDYQQPIFDEAIIALAGRGTRAQVVMACGTGKTHVGLRTAEAVVENAAISAPVVVLMFPNLALLSQTAKSWRKHSAWDFVGIAVCSDVSTDERDGETISETADKALEGTHLGYTTDPRTVTWWTEQNTGKARVIFATYQSADVLGQALRAMKRKGTNVDFLIADEAHRTAGEDLPGEDPSPFGLVLDNTKIPAHRRLFMTATPKNVRGSGTGVRSMSNVAQYGVSVGGGYPFRRAINDGNLLDYEVHVVQVTAAHVASTMGCDPRDITKDWARPGSRKATHDVSAVALTNMIERKNLRSVMVFHNRVKDSIAFTRTVQGIARGTGRPIEVHHVDANTPLAERSQVINKMRAASHTPDGPTIVVSNVAVFTEGVDVPEMDAIMVADRKASKIEVAQIVGRALRLPTGASRGAGHDHKPALILLPAVAFDHDNDIDVSVTSGTEFQDVWATLRALGETDSDLVEEIQSALADATARRSSTAQRRNRSSSHDTTDQTTDTGGDANPDLEAAIVDLVRDDVATPGSWILNGDGTATHVLGGASSRIALVVPEADLPEQLVAPTTEQENTAPRTRRSKWKPMILFTHGIATKARARTVKKTLTLSDEQVQEITTRVARHFDTVATHAIYSGRRTDAEMLAWYSGIFASLVRRAAGSNGKWSVWPSLHAFGTGDTANERALAYFLFDAFLDVAYKGIPRPDVDATFTHPSSLWTDGVAAQIKADYQTLASNGHADWHHLPKKDPENPRSLVLHKALGKIEHGAETRAAAA